MPPSESSSSSSRTTNARKSKKRRVTREDLLRALEILGPLSVPLPPELPPSPPASRSSSPARGTKRKQPAPAEASTSTSYPKRPRVSSVATDSTRAVRTDPTEDGEVGEERTYKVAQPAFTSTFVPVRRPRRGCPAKNDPIWAKRSELYHGWGVLLKNSCAARHNSMRPPSDSHFKPLEHPPPPDSSYHKHGALIAFLESIHAILCFVYAMWCREYPLRHTDTAAWTSIGSVLDWCESHVGKGGFNAGEREEALVGLVHMVRAFIESRNALLSSRHYVRYEMGKLAKQGDDTANAEHRRLLNETRESALKNNPAFRHLRDPPTQLPSPAPTANGSASSTPTANRAEGTPLQSSIRTPPSSSGSEQPKTMLDLDQFVLKSTASPPAILQTITLPLRGNVAKAVSQQAEQLHRAIKNVESYQSKLSLPILAKHFPITFARVIQTTLQQHEEYEPDFEDDEGELFWPGQCINGEGIGWVCLLGRSMIKEFGKDIGYQGYRGFVRLPDWRTNSKLPPGHPALQLPDIPDCW